MYHVAGTGIITSLFYLVSYLFYRNGLYTNQTHRKLWNTILAVSFFLTALAGLFMALQINYKWDIPYVKQILKWHVEFGIGMAFTGIFHFLWHLPYFKGIFTRQESNKNQIRNNTSIHTDIGTNLFLVGFFSTAIQLLLIREMINIAGGYELITGIFLASWLIGSSAGSVLAGRSLNSDIKRINLVFSLSPIISLVMMLLLSGLYLNPGQTPSLLESVIFTFLVLIPFCLVSGFTFIKLIAYAASEKNYVAGKSFAFETAGGILSGLLIPVLTAGLLNTYQILVLLIVMSLGYSLLTYYLNTNRVKVLTRILIFCIASVIIIFNPDIVFRQLLMPGIKVKYSKDTPYGNISKGEYKGESSTYYNQRLLTYKNDAIEKEENIHYAMVQSPAPESVLLISGSLKSHLPEILKYPVKKIIYIERDPELISLENISTDSLTKNLTIINTDAFRYIKSMKENVDVVILLVPPPSTLILNRYYTTEFFNEVKQHLNPGGIFMCSPGPGDYYLNKESLNLYSSVFNSLSAVFKKVIPVAGNKLYFIASDNELSSSVCGMLETRKIRNIYVGPDYLADDLIGQKSRETVALMDKNVRQNSADFPIANYHFQAYNFSKNINEKTPVLVIILIFFAAPVLTVKKRNITMYFTASAMAGFEIILLVTLQLTIGNMYQLTGLIIASLMAGLAIGAASDNRFINSITVIRKCLILIIFYAIAGLTYSYILQLENRIVVVIFLSLSALIPAIITGSIFRVLTMNNSDQNSCPATYSADLSGSAFGFILLSGFTVPVFGTVVSIYLLSIMIFAGILFGTIGNK